MRILLVDDNASVRRGLRMMLAERADWSVCGEAADGIEAIRKARETRPDLILMDISMPRMDGLKATRAIRSELPGTAVVIISQNEPAVIQQQSAHIGASAGISKNDLARDLIPCIERISQEKPVLILPESSRRASAGMSGVGDLTRYFPGNTEMAERMRAFDWSQTPLGPIEKWSAALRMMVPVLLANRFPLLLWWGPQFIQLYNDAYVPVLGDKHPHAALGKPFSECWSEVFDVLGPLAQTPFDGGPATWMEDIPLEVNRFGFVEETHFTIAYSPVPDETAPGGIGGVLAAAYEISGKVVGERRTNLLRDLGAGSMDAKMPATACALAAEVISDYAKDVPFAMLYLVASDRKLASLAGTSGIQADTQASPQQIRLDDGELSGAWPLSKVLGTRQPELVQLDSFEKIPSGPWSDPPKYAVVLPLRSNVAHQLAGFLIAGLSPRLRFDDAYRGFLELTASQIATAVANAQAYEVEQKRAEALAELDRAKTVFFSNVSHEFRTPLTLMLGPLQDLLSKSHTHLSPTAREQLELVNRNGARLLRLVNTLLDFSRIEAGRVQAAYQATDLSALTADLASTFRAATERAGLGLVVDCRDIGEPVYVDRDLWEKIVLNLVSNAFKFTMEGEIAIRVQRVGGDAELRIHDTCVGIPAEEMPKLFERFHRIPNTRSRTFEGSGIGLALVQELVRLHGGSIRVESVVDQGTTFFVRVPLGSSHLPTGQVGGSKSSISTAVGAAPFVEEALLWLPDVEHENEPVLSDPRELLPMAAPRIVTAEAPRPRVLIADDNSDMRQYLVHLLRREYEVQAVANGQEAIQSAQKRPPDLVLSDVMMPIMDGFELLKALRANERTRTIPIILLSARAGEESRVEGVEKGADDYLVKPFSARELVARVQTHLELASVRREADQTIRENEERLRMALTVTDTGTFRWNPHTGEYLAFDDNLKHLFGKPAGQFTVTEDVIKLVHPEDVPAVVSAVDASRRGADFSMDYRIVVEDGSIRWLHHRAKMEHESDGKPTYIVGACTDITARKRNESLVLEQNRSLELIASGCPLDEILAQLTAASEPPASRRKSGCSNG